MNTARLTPLRKAKNPTLLRRYNVDVTPSTDNAFMTKKPLAFVALPKNWLELDDDAQREWIAELAEVLRLRMSIALFEQDDESTGDVES